LLGCDQEGQQWGDAHGIDMDTSAFDRLDIIKGPASFMSGSDALAGVVHSPSPLHLVLQPRFQGLSPPTLTPTTDCLEAPFFSRALSMAWSGEQASLPGRPTLFPTPLDEQVYNPAFTATDATGFIGVPTNLGWQSLHIIPICHLARHT